MIMESILEVKELVKNYGKVKAVDGISFSIPRGICFGLLGPNGAGKTTALETIEDIKKPTSGTILYNSRERDELFREDVGIQFQETALLSFLTVKETLETFMNLYSSSMPLDKVIDICHLGDILNQFNDKISGGQKQRLLLALAMINDPVLLFLDEPSTGMDPQNRRNMWEIIRSIKKQGKTIVLTTHYMEEAESLCDVVAIMDHGKIIAEGQPGRLVREYSKHVSVILPGDVVIKKDNLCGSVYELDNYIELQTDDINSCIQELLGQGVDLTDMTVRSPNLEDVFINLTGRRLRE
jgi:ABC-2 type transport system ATP-binding protein